MLWKWEHFHICSRSIMFLCCLEILICWKPYVIPDFSLNYGRKKWIIRLDSFKFYHIGALVLWLRINLSSLFFSFSFLKWLVKFISGFFHFASMFSFDSVLMIENLWCIVFYFDCGITYMVLGPRKLPSCGIPPCYDVNVLFLFCIFQVVLFSAQLP